MTRKSPSKLSRRQLLQAGALAGAGLAIGGRLHAVEPQASSLIMKMVPASGERLPALGIGTNAFRESNYSDVKAVLQRMAELGGTVIDTAAAYGESEGVIGRALAELGLRERMFISTKFNAVGKGWGPWDDVSGRDSFERSLQRLRTTRVDLLEVHRLQGLDTLMSVMQEYKQSGRIRYLGVTTFRNEEHGSMVEAMRRYPLDFIQIDYSLANRNAAKEVFPLALERKAAVMVNVPLGGRRGSLISETAGRKLPDWATEIDVTSWSQFFLKYVISHPAVTCVIPGTTQLRHLEDNQAAGRGRLPDAALRRRMEEYWDA
jgi:aryl-alcohol dehydrogenase-like predicted oxidoreductase